MVTSLGYDPETQTLAVRFKRGGALYHYHDVTEDKYKHLLAADSIGKHLQAHILGAGHRHTKQEEK